MYTKRIRPGLSEANRVKQIAFSKHVHNRWGLAKDIKVLWTMSDEKWWLGLVSKKTSPKLVVNRAGSTESKTQRGRILKVAQLTNCWLGCER